MALPRQIMHKGHRYVLAMEYSGFGKVGPPGSDKVKAAHYRAKAQICKGLAAKLCKSNPQAAQQYAIAAEGFSSLAHYGYFGKDDGAVEDYHSKAMAAVRKANGLVRASQKKPGDGSPKKRASLAFKKLVSSRNWPVAKGTEDYKAKTSHGWYILRHLKQDSMWRGFYTSNKGYSMAKDFPATPNRDTVVTQMEKHHYAKRYAKQYAK